MAIRSISDLTEAFNSMFAEEDLNTDDKIGFIEDLTDTVNAGSENLNWKEKYENNDKEWREKYRRRFMTGEDDSSTPNIETIEDDETKRAATIKISDLFTQAK